MLLLILYWNYVYTTTTTATASLTCSEGTQAIETLHSVPESSSSSLIIRMVIFVASMVLVVAIAHRDYLVAIIMVRDAESLKKQKNALFKNDNAGKKTTTWPISDNPPPESSPDVKRFIPQHTYAFIIMEYTKLYWKGLLIVAVGCCLSYLLFIY